MHVAALRSSSRHDAPPAPSLELQPLDSEKVFYLLGNAKRRRLLLALADGVGKAVSPNWPRRARRRTRRSSISRRCGWLA